MRKMNAREGEEGFRRFVRKGAFRKLWLPIMIVTCLVFFAYFNYKDLIPAESTMDLQTIPAENTVELKTCEMHPQDGGDCQAIGPRRPPWACHNKIKASIPQFMKLYENRPAAVNTGGMRLEHSLAMWYTLKHIQPKPTTVIESGVHRGQSTWLILSTLPGVRMFCIDPSRSVGKHPGPVYFTGRKFKDFNEIDWRSHNLDVSNTVFFVDDHQSGFRRVLKEGRKLGIKHFVLDDNYDFLEGDNYSMKWACERKRRDKWRQYIPDHFGRSKNRTTWEEHLENGKQLDMYVKSYYEFPPLASLSDTGTQGTSLTSDSYRTTPLLTREELSVFNQSTSMNVYEEIQFYRSWVYVELY